MRWERLFDDLAAQWEAEQAAELAAEVGERTRIELSRSGMADRLRAVVGTTVTLACGGDEPGRHVRGRLTRVGSDVAIVEELPSRGLATAGTLVALGAVDWVAGVGRAAAPLAGTAAITSPSLTSLLRAVARDRLPVTLGFRGGGRLDGTVDAVGADWLDLALHAVDEPRRVHSVRETRAVSLAALATVVTRG